MLCNNSEKLLNNAEIEATNKLNIYIFIFWPAVDFDMSKK